MGEMASGGQSAEQAPPSFVELATRILESSGARMTVVRRILCEVLQNAEHSMSSDQLLTEAKKRDPLISMSSVYRTLKFLSDAELLRQIDGLDGERRFEKADLKTAASHIVCRDCGIVVSLSDPCLAIRETPAIRAEGFHRERISLRVEAKCTELAETGDCKRRNRAK